MKLRLETLPGRYAVSKLPALSELPPFPKREARKASVPALFSLSSTDGEIFLVAPESFTLPNCEKRAEGFRALRVAGTLDFGLIGILAKLTGILAAEKIPVFVVSTYDTDYLLIREEFLEPALEAFAGTSLESEIVFASETETIPSSETETFFAFERAEDKANGQDSGRSKRKSE